MHSSIPCSLFYKADSMTLELLGYSRVISESPSPWALHWPLQQGLTRGVAWVNANATQIEGSVALRDARNLWMHSVVLTDPLNHLKVFTRTNIQRHVGELWWSRQSWPLNASLGADCFQKHYLAAYCGQPILLYQTLIKDTLEIQQKKWAVGDDRPLSITIVEFECKEA